MFLSLFVFCVLESGGVKLLYLLSQVVWFMFCYVLFLFQLKFCNLKKKVHAFILGGLWGWACAVLLGCWVSGEFCFVFCYLGCGVPYI